MAQYDVTVIGAGPGGYVAAIRAAQRGAKVALVEKAFLGGTCLNWGCIPTKTLIASANVLTLARHAADFGVDLPGGAPSPNWAAMRRRKDKVVTGLRNGIATLVSGNRIDLVEGTASFVDRRHLRVQPTSGEVRTLETAATIVATGSESVMPAFVPKASNVLDSKAALDLPDLPGHLLILGAGIIGCEFACLFARLGVKVTLVELLPEILPTQDRDVALVVRTEMRHLGIDVHTNTRLADLQADGQRVTATAGDTALTADALLVCVGRRPVTAGLNLSAVGIQPDAAGLIAVRDTGRTVAAGVYAIGDVASPIQLAHWASAQGLVAAHNATGKPDRVDPRVVPGCIFTAPEIGSVGLTEAQAKQQGQELKVGKFPFAALGKAQTLGETAGFCKVLADPGTDQVLGVHIVGPHATDLIGEAAAAMELETTAAELARVIHPHPTLCEAVMEAAHAVHDECIHAPPRKHRKA